MPGTVPEMPGTSANKSLVVFCNIPFKVQAVAEKVGFFCFPCFYFLPTKIRVKKVG